MTGDSLPGFQSAFIGAWLLMGTGVGIRLLYDLLCIASRKK